MLKKNWVVAFLATASLMMGASASAQMYAGASVGQSKSNIDCAGTLKCDKTATAYKIFGGYQIDKIFAIEGTYFDLGKNRAELKYNGVTTSNTVKSSGFELAGLAKYDFTEDLSGFVKLGVARVSADASSSAVGKFNVSTNSTQAVYGVGMNYKLTKDVALRAELESRRSKLFDETARVNTLTVGAQMSF